MKRTIRIMHFVIKCSFSDNNCIGLGGSGFPDCLAFVLRPEKWGVLWAQRTILIRG